MKRLIPIPLILFASSLVLADDAPASKPASQPATQTSLHATIEPGLYWNLLRTEQFGMAIPQNWSNLPPRANMVMFIAKQGIKDETRQPLEVGMSIERLTKATDTIDQEAKKLIERYSAEKAMTIEGKPTTEHVKLADGQDAVIVSLTILMNNRQTYMQKLLAASPAYRWVISAYVTAGDKSIMTRPDSDMARKLRAHLLTFTLDPNKLDQEPLTRAYLTPQQPPAPTTQPSSQPKK
jgi:hypothetical protein